MTPDPPTQRFLVLMMKAPVPGKVKTRLAAEIGPERATALYRKFVEHLIGALFAPADRTWRPVIAYSPADSGDAVRDWLGPLVPRETLFLPQPEGDLGARLERVFADGFDAGADSVIAIGADCLDIDATEIRSCFDALADAPVVMGEALDGGYWLIGMSGRHFELFESMPWSTSRLAEATRERARQLNLKIAERAKKSDVDTKADLDGLGARLKQKLGIDEAD